MKPYYDKDGITIYHERCEIVLPHLSNVDLLLTDPPYGLKEAAGKNKSRGLLAQPKDYGFSDWDSAPPEEWMIGQMISKATWQILWGGNFFSGLSPSSCWLVWDKDNGNTDFADCELAWTNLRQAVRKLHWRWNGMLQQHGGNKKEDRHHPTQKPLEVMKWSILQAPDDCETILDPYMGSGTTLVAAKQLGKRAIGIEQEEKYCEIAASRLSQGVLAFG